MFKCNLCREEFKSLFKLNVHIERHHGGVRDRKKKSFKCNVCGFELSRKTDLMNHVRTHTGERPFKCKFNNCGKAFKQDSTLNDHIKFKHSDERPFNCEFQGCLHTAKTLTNLIHHQKVHCDERPFACTNDGCSYRAKSKTDVTRHVKCVHRKAEMFDCPQCSYKTALKWDLMRHLTVHEGRTEIMSCSTEGCAFRAKTSQGLKVHIRRHKKLLPCPVSGCGRYKPTKEALSDHVKIHNALSRPFRCPLCVKHFKTLGLLQSHCAVHTNEKPLRCGHCEYAGARQGDVKYHISKRHGDVEFPCIFHLLDDRECLRCKIILPGADFLVHCQGHDVQRPGFHDVKT